jgi:hypothetical protein
VGRLGIKTIQEVSMNPQTALIASRSQLGKVNNPVFLEESKKSKPLELSWQLEMEFPKRSLLECD